MGHREAWKSRRAYTSKGGRLFGADGEDLLVLNFDFNAEGRANVAALNHSTADPDVARKVNGFQGIKEGAAARITD